MPGQAGRFVQAYIIASLSLLYFTRQFFFLAACILISLLRDGLDQYKSIEDNIWLGRADSAGGLDEEALTVVPAS